MRVGHDERVHPLIEQGYDLLRELLVRRTEVEQ
jgi:hypothetical protein